MNTPQFDWMRNKMPNKPQPMGTIFQPEAAARTVHYAAYHPEREYKVGLPTMQAIIGNKLLPAVGDWVLAKNGFKGQQTDEPKDKDPLDNLFEPAPGLFGAHGRFDCREKEKSWVGQLGIHKMIPTVAAVLAGILTAEFLMRR